MTDDPDVRDSHARAGAEIARRLGDADLEFCAMSYEGLGLVLRGRIADGMRRIDEAAAAASGGEVRVRPVPRSGPASVRKDYQRIYGKLPA